MDLDAEPRELNFDGWKSFGTRFDSSMRFRIRKAGP